MAKLSQKQLAELRGEYLKLREELLIKRVDALAVKLFERVFNDYLAQLEQNDGKLVSSDRNISLVKGLDVVFDLFNTQNNIPVVSGFVKDLQGITPLNERYFKNLTGRDIQDSTIKAQAIVNKRIGVDSQGNLTRNGFAEKFINDKTLLKTIKKETTKAITSRMGFQEFRVGLKETIQGNPTQKLSGGLQQYYRNYAYDTFMRVDRLNQDVFAKDLGLRYFIWSGGIIQTTRPICAYCNDKIVDSEGPFKDLQFSDIKDSLAKDGGGNLKPFNSGMNEDWIPLLDLGQFACRHRKDFILDSVAERLPGRFLDINFLTK